MVGALSICIVTSSLEAAHTPLLIVHLKVEELPGTNPVKVEVGDEVVVIVAMPDTTLHEPVPTLATLPAKVPVVTLHKV